MCVRPRRNEVRVLLIAPGPYRQEDELRSKSRGSLSNEFARQVMEAVKRGSSKGRWLHARNSLFWGHCHPCCLIDFHHRGRNDRQRGENVLARIRVLDPVFLILLGTRVQKHILSGARQSGREPIALGLPSRESDRKNIGRLRENERLLDYLRRFVD